MGRERIQWRVCDRVLAPREKAEGDGGDAALLEGETIDVSGADVVVEFKNFPEFVAR